MKQKSLFIFLLLLCVFAAMGKEKSAEAKYLHDFLHDNYGKNIISGVTACVDWNINEAMWVNQHTGKWPAINQFDFIHIDASTPGGWVDYSDSLVAIDWARNGGIVAALWHWGMPNNDGTDKTCTPGRESGQTSFSPSCIYDTDSEGYSAIINDIDRVAEYLKPLQKEGIPVLWRPLHEAQGNWSEQYPNVDWHTAWFWWGIDGPEVYVDLWRLMYDRMVNHHGLDNLIWVFNVGDSYRWYPGDDYVDIVGSDLYDSKNATKWYADFPVYNDLYYPKPLAICEAGNIPSLSEFWANNAKYSYFCTWYDYNRTNNPKAPAFRSSSHESMNKAQWIENMALDYVLTREDLPCFLKTIDVRNTIWEGSYTPDWIWDKMTEVTSPVLNDLQEGDYLHFTLKVDDDAWINFYTYPERVLIDSRDLPETEGFHPGRNHYRMKLTADLISQMKKGFYLFGGGYTLTQIELVRSIDNPDFPNGPLSSDMDLVFNPAAPEGMYDMLGRKIESENPAPGIYIVNGRKTLIRR